MITAQQIIDNGVCPHIDGEICHDCHNDPSQLSYSMGDMADLTHATQVAIFNWCGCEDGERQYGDCPTRIAKCVVCLSDVDISDNGDDNGEISDGDTICSHCLYNQ
jgi:hypothetical protein